MADNALLISNKWNLKSEILNRKCSNCCLKICRGSSYGQCKKNLKLLKTREQKILLKMPALGRKFVYRACMS